MIAELRAIALISISASALTAACTDSFDPSLPQSNVQGWVTGLVFSPDSVPVAGAAIEFLAGFGACDATHDDLVVGSAASDSLGRYYAGVEGNGEVAPDGPDSTLRMCVRALPPLGSGSPSDWVRLDIPRTPGDEYLGSYERDLYLMP